MDNNFYEDITQTLLNQVEKYAGFTPFLGLFDGKMGIAILLYHGSRCFCSAEMESVADCLIDDIVNEKSLLRESRFAKGSSDIAWGFNHLMMNGFIDSDSDFFNDIDNLLFQNETVSTKIHLFDHLFLGFYILSRYENSKDKTYWNVQADSYCNRIMDLIKTNLELFIKNPDLLTTYWYCLWKWSEYNLPFIEQNENIDWISSFYQNFGCKEFGTLNRILSNQFYYKFCKKDVSTKFPEITTIGDVNAIFLDKLLYRDMVLPCYESLNGTIGRLSLDYRLLNELLLGFNHQNIGISRYVSGFAWTLLVHKHHIELQ